MIKNLLFSTLFILSGIIAFGQTTGTDFNATDCSNNPHHLFGELNSGKVVVIAWVMPCFSCIQDPIAAYNIVQQYENDNPGQILFYLADDYANTSCNSLGSWASQYNFDNAIVISDSEVNMGDYGVAGMPKIVVLSGIDHEIFYNQNSSTNGFTDALEDALNSTSIEVNEGFNFETSVYPNPAQDNVQFAYTLNSLSNVSIELFNVIGEKINVIEEDHPVSIGEHTLQIDTSDLSNGVYMISLNVGTVTESLRFTISK